MRRREKIIDGEGRREKKREEERRRDGEGRREERVRVRRGLGFKSGESSQHNKKSLKKEFNFSNDTISSCVGTYVRS